MNCDFRRYMSSGSYPFHISEKVLCYTNSGCASVQLQQLSRHANFPQESQNREWDKAVRLCYICFTHDSVVFKNYIPVGIIFCLYDPASW